MAQGQIKVSPLWGEQEVDAKSARADCHWPIQGFGPTQGAHTSSACSGVLASDPTDAHQSVFGSLERGK